jgi:hypothetical protein
MGKSSTIPSRSFETTEPARILFGERSVRSRIPPSFPNNICHLLTVFGIRGLSNE